LLYPSESGAFLSIFLFFPHSRLHGPLRLPRPSSPSTSLHSLRVPDGLLRGPPDPRFTHAHRAGLRRNGFRPPLSSQLLRRAHLFALPFPFAAPHGARNLKKELDCAFSQQAFLFSLCQPTMALTTSLPNADRPQVSIILFH